MSGTERNLDSLCQALSDRTRRRILERLGLSPGATTGELAAGEASMTRWAVAKHLEVLRAAGLVRTLPEGRRRRHYREAAALGPLSDWIAANQG
jgi:DNA-binding transcriptional ArsR family regulator